MGEDDGKSYANDAYEVTENGKDAETTVVAEQDANSVAKEESKGEERATWGSGMEFLMSCIAMSVGLGNIWRFPFTAYENGGGAFLIPYIIVLFLVGKPMYYMEMILGQFSNRNNVRVWVINPGFRAVGLGQLISTLSIVSYYVSLMALTLFYLIQSFRSPLPWAECKPEWGDCFDANTNETISGNSSKKSSSELYFLNVVIREYDNIDNGLGAPDWRLTICLFVSWVGIFLVMIRGVKSSGKAAYFLALFPYVIMFALLIRAVTLPGAGKGILYFITPNWKELYNPKVWYAAVTQAFFSLSVCVGAIIMFSSYNKFSHNVYRDAMIVTTLDTFTSLLSGFTIFGILGNLADSLGTDDINEVIGSGGTGLAFISYPSAIAQFNWVPQLFAVLFFLMLFVLGLGSAVSLQSSIITVLADRFPSRKFWQMALVGSICGFCTGLIYITPGGQFIFTLVDKFGATFLLLGMAIAEIAGIFWFYGLESFCNDIEFMTGRKVSAYWRWCWGVITPLIMIIVFIYAFVADEKLMYGDKDLPPAAHAAGWTVLGFGLLQIPIWMVVAYFQNGKSWKRTFHATEKWGPKSAETKRLWRNYKEEAKKSRKVYGNPKWKHILYSLNGTYDAPSSAVPADALT